MVLQVKGGINKEWLLGNGDCRTRADAAMRRLLGLVGKVRVGQSRGVGVERQTGQQDGEPWENGKSVLVKRPGRHEPVTDIKAEKRKLA